MNNNTSATTTAGATEQDGKTFSAFLPPPPIFKPRFVHMQRSNSLSDSPPTPSSKPGAGAGASGPSPSSTPVDSQASTLVSTPFSSFESPNSSKIQGGAGGEITKPVAKNSNFLTSSFVSNEEYRNYFLSHSPSISPMTRYTDMPLPDDTDMSSANNSTAGNNKLNPNPPIRQAKKRRRSSAYNKEEIERKKKELKTQHSIIEKRRRIKMNREFEALKFLVPACRLNILTGLNDGNFDNSTMMHKLTILQSTVEYIKYLHLIIKLMKLQMLIPKDTRDMFKSWIQKNDNLNFVDFDLDLQSYRDIESEFSFENIFLKVWENDGGVPNDWLDPITKEIIKVLSPSAEPPAAAKPSKQPPTTNERAQRTNPSMRSQSHPNIHTPSTILEERIQQNSEYRNSILKLQQESNSFKLPLPAIIDKHPDLGILNSAGSRSNTGLADMLPSPSSSSYVPNTSPLSNTHSPATSSSTPAYRIGSNNATTSPLKQVLPPPLVSPSRPLFPGGSTTPRNHFSSMSSSYSLANSGGSNFNPAAHSAIHGSLPHRPVLATETRLSTERSRNNTLPSPDRTHYSGATPATATSPDSGSGSSSGSVSVSPEQKGSAPDHHSPEIHAASRLLIEIKSSKRHSSIQDILN